MAAFEWTNWSGSVSCRPARFALPADETELAALVAQTDPGLKIRVAGSGHSFVPLVACDELLVSLERLAGIESIDSARGEATIRAGTVLGHLGRPLAEAGWALENQGDVDTQTLAGAVATGTHGTGPALGSISTQVVALRLIDARGQLHHISRSDNPRLLRAAAISLGALGIVTALTLRLVKAYRLHERTWEEPIEWCLARLDERIAATRHFEFFWYPAGDRAQCKSLAPTEAEPGAASDLPGQRVGPSWAIFPTLRTKRFNEMEYAVPAEAGPGCFAALRRLVVRSHPDVAWPIEYRTVAADDLDLSPAQGRPTVALSIHEGAERPHAAYFSAAETIFRAHGGRPHWGKHHGLERRQLAPLYQGFEAFCQTREALDPAGRLMTPYLRRLLVEAS